MFDVRRLSFLLVLLGSLSAIAPASETAAATISYQDGMFRPWAGPGTNPCGDLCDREWALGLMQGILPEAVSDEIRHLIRNEAPVTHYVSSGDRILAMTYAKGGEPYLDLTPRIARFGAGVSYRAEGYIVSVGAVAYQFVQIEACGNWALIVDPDGGLLTIDEVLLPTRSAANFLSQLVDPGPGALAGALAGAEPQAAANFSDPPVLFPPTTGILSEPRAPTPMVAIPLPSSLWLLGIGIGALLIFRRRMDPSRCAVSGVPITRRLVHRSSTA